MGNILLACALVYSCFFLLWPGWRGHRLKRYLRRQTGQEPIIFFQFSLSRLRLCYGAYLERPDRTFCVSLQSSPGHGVILEGELIGYGYPVFDSVKDCASQTILAGGEICKFNSLLKRFEKKVLHWHSVWRKRHLISG